MDGGWSDWSVGNCSVNCGGGVKEKFRVCDNPKPSCGGKECSGMKVETIECNEFSCEDEGMKCIDIVAIIYAVIYDRMLNIIIMYSRKFWAKFWAIFGILGKGLQFTTRSHT